MYGSRRVRRAGCGLFLMCLPVLAVLGLVGQVADAASWQGVLVLAVAAVPLAVLFWLGIKGSPKGPVRGSDRR